MNMHNYNFAWLFVLRISVILMILQFNNNKDGGITGMVDATQDSRFTLGCDYHQIEENLIASVNGSRVTAKEIRVAVNNEIKFRCDDIGEFILKGSRVLTCTEQGFKEDPPSCKQLLEWAENLPPMITYGVDEGNHSVSDDGRLLLEKGSTVVFICYWQPNHATWLLNGNQINLTDTDKYGFWTGEGNLEMNLLNVTEEFNGYYSCTTYPDEMTHGINVTVIDTNAAMTTESTTSSTTESATSSTTGSDTSSTTGSPTSSTTESATRVTTGSATSSTTGSATSSTTGTPTSSTTGSATSSTTESATSSTTESATSSTTGSATLL